MTWTPTFADLREIARRDLMQWDDDDLQARRFHLHAEAARELVELLLEALVSGDPADLEFAIEIGSWGLREAVDDLRVFGELRAPT